MKGYYLVVPDFRRPEVPLSEDAQVRCLAYIIKRIRDIITVRPGLIFEVIPVCYLGGPYPAIGMSDETDGDPEEDLTMLSFSLEGQIDAFISEIGLDQLLELSKDEDMRWEDVVTSTVWTTLG